MAKKITFEELKDVCADAYDFFKKTEGKELPPERFDLSNGVYVSVQSYDTHDRCFRRSESHKKYIDIQYVLSGREIIEISRKQLRTAVPYNVENDIEFYSLEEREEEITVNEGELLLIEEGELHTPALQTTDKPEHVKKAVIKVPVRPDHRVKYLVMDVDGTMTDGKIDMGQDGELFKSFNIKDGMAMKIALSKGITPIILTGRTSKIVGNRAKEIGISRIYQGVVDKPEKLKEITADLSEIAYIGDDINDVECMIPIREAGGITACVKDACREAIEAADYVTLAKGGEGAIREFVEFLVG